VLDFATPPEIISGRIYAGPGAGSFTEAASAWQGLASELESFALGYTSVLGALVGVWQGPSALAMTRAALPYITWAHSTAAEASQTAMSAQAAASAFFTAFTSVVPPEVIAANRTLFATLVVTNLFGQNTAAIAAAEAQYAEMWAQDTAAMLGYQTQSAAALQLPTFSLPSSITGLINPSGIPIIGLDNSTLLGQYLQSFLSSGPYQVPTELLGLFTVLWGVSAPSSVFSRLSAVANAAPTEVVESSVPVPKAPSVRISVGNGNRIGSLSVPPGWASPVTPQSPVRPLLPPGGGAQGRPVGLPVIPAIPVARGGTPNKEKRPEPEYGQAVRFITRPPAGG
jgi:PPE-repeat protein